MDKDFSRSKPAIFASYIKPHKKAFAIDMALSVGIAVVDLVFPYVSRWSMRSLLPDGLYRAFFTVMVIMFLLIFVMVMVVMVMMFFLGSLLGQFLQFGFQSILVFQRIQNVISG